jgi:hypothetical protein
MEALTKTPATVLGVYDKVGSIDAGKLANFLVTNGPIFNDKDGYPYQLGAGYQIHRKRRCWQLRRHLYFSSKHSFRYREIYTRCKKSGTSVTMFGKDTLNAKLNFDGKQVKLSYAPHDTPSAPNSGSCLKVLQDPVVLIVVVAHGSRTAPASNRS